MRETTNTREELLKAAEQLVAQAGVKNLTIEQVARAAGVSRGGVFYHFPSKEALIQGMVARLVDQFQQALEHEMARDPEPHGRMTRAYARLTLGPDEGIAAVMSALIAGIAFDPKLLDPLTKQLAIWQAQSEAELDPTTAAIVRLTAHALWTNGLLLTNTFTPEQLRGIVARLEQMTRGA